MGRPRLDDPNRCSLCRKSAEIEVFFYKLPLCQRCWNKYADDDETLKKKLNIKDDPESLKRWDRIIEENKKQSETIKSILADQRFKNTPTLKIQNTKIQ